MGAFRYCINDDCNCPLKEPTPSEDLLEGQICKSCGTEQPRIYSTEEWIVKMFDKINEVKEHINKISENGFTRVHKNTKSLRKRIQKLEKIK